MLAEHYKPTNQRDLFVNQRKTAIIAEAENWIANNEKAFMAFERISAEWSMDGNRVSARDVAACVRNTQHVSIPNRITPALAKIVGERRGIQFTSGRSCVFEED